MKIGELMALVNECACVKIEYTDVTDYSSGPAHLAGRETRQRETIRVPHVDEHPCSWNIYPFDSKEEIYDIDIDTIDVGSDDSGEGQIFLITNYIKKHK